MGKAIMTKSKSGQRIKINSWKVIAEKNKGSVVPLLDIFMVFTNWRLEVAKCDAHLDRQTSLNVFFFIIPIFRVIHTCKIAYYSIFFIQNCMHIGQPTMIN